jgi:MFS transporter, PAT family, solute carrier family 33 (acetyl-CoA transportor), member 1
VEVLSKVLKYRKDSLSHWHFIHPTTIDQTKIANTNTSTKYERLPVYDMSRRALRFSNSMTATSDKVAPVATTVKSHGMAFSRSSFYSKAESSVVPSTPVRLKYHTPSEDVLEHKDEWNYLLLIALYTLQGIPMGLSASIPFLIQQKIRILASSTAQGLAESVITNLSDTATVTSSTAAATAAARSSYNANAIFALCSWPFSLKLLWAPIVDSCYWKGRYGRRKSWIVPIQSLAGLLMIVGADFVERQLGVGTGTLSAATGHALGESINVKGVTAFFFILYFLMATQDIAVDGWALTMLSKKNRGRGPICNSIGQNIGYFLSFVGFLALNDAESCEVLWRPLFGLKSNPDRGLISLGYFIRSMGYLMLLITTVVAFVKRELVTTTATTWQSKVRTSNSGSKYDDEKELDAAEIGLVETYHRLWAVCKLPAVQWLFFILLTYRLPTSLGDNVKFLKAVEFGLSKSTTAVRALTIVHRSFLHVFSSMLFTPSQLLSPTIILPLGIIVPIIATRIWHDSPLQQFMTAYKLRVTLVPILDVMMLMALRRGKPDSTSELMSYWSFIICSTALQAIVSSMQFNAQMTFFAKRVDPAIGGSYMTLLNTAANLGGTWPASFVMWLMGVLSKDPVCVTNLDTGVETCKSGNDPFFHVQAVLSILGMLWIFFLGKRVRIIETLPDDVWRTHVLDSGTSTTKLKSNDEESLLSSVDVELAPKRGNSNGTWR